MALNAIVNPLVDALSLLVLECVGGSLKDVTTHCMALATQTQALVNEAQKVAMSSDDTEVVNEIINSINIIADQIGSLVESFQALITNRTDPSLVKNFSSTAQNVADAISSLVNATDETSQKRLIALVRRAIQSNKDLEGALARNNRADILMVGAKFQEVHSKLVDVCELALSASNIPHKKSLLREAAGELRVSAPNLVECLKHVFDEPQSLHWNNQHDDLSGRIGGCYKKVIEAMKMEEASEFEKLRVILNAIGHMIEAGSALQTNAGKLIKGFSTDAGVSERMGYGNQTAQSAGEMVKHATDIRNAITDPTIQLVVDGAIASVKKNAGKLQTLSALPTLTAVQKGEAAQAYQDLINAAQRLVTSTRTNAMKDYPVHMSTEALNALLQGILDSAESGLVNEMMGYAARATQMAKELCAQLEDMASKTQDPKERQALLDAAERIKAGVVNVIAAAKNFLANPNDPAALERLRQAIGEIQAAIELARILETTPAGFAPLVVEKPKATDLKNAANFSFNAFDLEPQPGDDELIRAAKEQALAALDIIREAERYLGQNPENDEKIRAANDAVREWAQRVVAAARVASANPDDPEAQAEMARCQNELAKAIAVLLGLTGKGNNSAVAEAMKGLQDAVGGQDDSNKEKDSGDAKLASEFYAIAAQIVKTINDNFKGDVKADVGTSREIALLSAKANKCLQGLASSVKNPQFKDQLSNSGKIITDNSLKLKILAAVKVSGGNDDTGQVASAAAGLKVQVEDIVSIVRAGSLRHRLQATTKQIAALRLIAEAVRKARLG
jgi:hypothetical protein